MSSSFSEDQLQPDDTLDERGVDDVLDEGMSPPERPSRDVARGVTAREDAQGESLDERIEQEEPDPSAEVDHSADAQEEALAEGEGTDPSDGDEIGDQRTGRLTADPDDLDDDVADDVGIDGAAASAEEAAVHTVGEDEL
ncbi:MAG TPA: DUF5709 domain-containing protein [Nocardioides sp.]|jgi:hypothetical protein|nr:DUF5709 domain-containing protein [Nocardioides sp.]